MTTQDRKTAIKPAYYFYGAEDYLAEEALAAIKSSALAPGFESMNYSAFDRASLDAGQAVSIAGTFPAFSGKRLIVVRGAGSLKPPEEEIFSAYLEDPSPFACLVFISDSQKVDIGVALAGLIREKGEIRQFKHQDAAALMDRVKRRARSLGKTISAGAASRLIELAGPGLRGVEAELEKIALFAGDKASIDEADVEEAGLDIREETIYRLTDAIGERDVKKALAIYGKLSDEPPVKVLVSMAFGMRALLKLKSALRKGPDARALAGAAGVPQWKLDSYARRSRLFSDEELKSAITKLCEADERLKTGTMPPEVAMESLIMELSMRKGPKGGYTG